MNQDGDVSVRMNNNAIASSSASNGDPLTTHPLLSFSPSTSDVHQVNSTREASSQPRYVPYTPRHRPFTTATTSTTISSSMATTAPSSCTHGGAAGKLQLQSLKATVQAMGLDNASVGWVILEKLVSGEIEGSEWDAIWQVIASGQVVLLLPAEKASAGLLVTPEFVRDHIGFCEGPMKDMATLVTLGGLRGTIDELAITFRTAISTTSEAFLAIQRLATRSAALSALPALSACHEPNAPYPSYIISDRQGSLHIPARTIPSQPPPLPPRPAPPTAPTASGLGGRFASLFGGSSRSPTPVPSPITPAPPAPLRPSSPQPTPSIRSEASVESAQSGQGSGNPYSSDGHFVTAFAIDHKIVRKDISKGVSKALKADLKRRLGTLPSWITERILNFTLPLQPLEKRSKLDSTPGNSPPSPAASGKETGLGVVLDASSAHKMAESFQSLYDSIEEELRKDKAWAGHALWRRSVDEDKGENGEELARDTSSEHDHVEQWVEEAMEFVEACVTTVFYDHLFRPSESDDASHDEALANRVAALNMLDLGWEHLGVEMDASNPDAKGIDAVIVACGRELEKLQGPAYRSPKAKAELLVAVHRIIVEGLSRLPPMRLKPDGEPTGDPLNTTTPRQEVFGAQHHEVTSPVQLEMPQTTPTSEMAPPKAKSPSLLSSPRAHQPSLRSASPAPSTPPPRAVSLALADGEPSLSPSPLNQQAKSSGAAVNTDVLLPIIIFSVVKANPVQLVSQLLFIERFRSRRVGGEESYCLINFLAVVEFLEHVDMQALGLGDADRVMNTQDLSPLPLSTTNVPSSPIASSPSARLRGRVGQQVGELATGATKVISGVGGVVDSSFSVLRGLLNVIPDPAANDEGRTSSPAAVVSAMITRPGFGLLRRGTGFSIAGVAASLPGTAARDKGGPAEQGQQMVEVPSRPGSVRRLHIDELDRAQGEVSDDEGSTSDAGYYNESERGDEPDHREGSVFRDKSDTRSIRSFSSMMSRDRDYGDEKERRERPSLTDRLANMPALHQRVSGTPPGSRRTSLLPPHRQNGTPSVGSPPIERIPPPNPRFIHSSAEDLRINEIPALLVEYRRVVDALRAMGGFQD